LLEILHAADNWIVEIFHWNDYVAHTYCHYNLQV
jgi:hypothetical protein